MTEATDEMNKWVSGIYIKSKLTKVDFGAQNKHMALSVSVCIDNQWCIVKNTQKFNAMIRTI